MSKSSSTKISNGKAEKDLQATISDADIERCRRQIGVSVPLRAKTHSPVASSATIENYAWSYGDDNPLFKDANYARNTRWRGIIAPPTFPIATGVCETPALEGEKKALFAGLFRGVGKYYSGVSWQFFRPIYPGDETFIDYSTSDVQVKESSFSGGRSVIETYRILHVDRAGLPVAVRYESYVNAERGGSKKTGKHADIERQVYTPEMIDAIDEAYAAEAVRGAEPRVWETVQIGDELTPCVKGPLTVTDIIGSHVGWGMGEYGIGPLRNAWHLRTHKLKGFYNRDEFGVPDVMQRMHWDPSWAQNIGLPAPYDYGQMRGMWMSHLLTNWMGDDAWLVSMSNRLTSFNFLGDTTLFKGRVVEKMLVGSNRCVRVEVTGTNQRETETLTGEAVIALPSKEGGAVALPVPESDLRERGAAIIMSRNSQ